MSLNDKRDRFDLDDLIAFARMAGVKANKARQIVESVGDAVHKWGTFAAQANVFPEHIDKVQSALRLSDFQLG